MAKNPKNSFLKRLEGRHTIKRVYGQSFYELNSTAILYFRYSKAHKNQFFFGVESDDVLVHQDRNLFILFICGTEDEIVVLPTEDFMEMVKGSDPISNQWKVFIERRNEEYRLRVAGKGRYDVSKNLNRFDFRPADFRSTSLPSAETFSPLGRKKKTKATIDRLPVVESLEDRLVASSSDSQHPVAFEKTVTEVFEKLGFKAKHIGGAGNTDVLLESPLRGIIDCKSTSVDALSHLNLSRMKRHKKENDADFLLVISKGFDRAVIRDAELEHCTLVPVDVLRELYMLSKRLTFSPLEMQPLFRKAGVITSPDLEYIREAERHFKQRIDSILRVITALDFKPREFKEIKGRLDYEAETKHRSEMEEEELSEILSLLSSPVISIVQRSQSAYCSRYSHWQSVERLNNILKQLLSPSEKE